MKTNKQKQIKVSKSGFRRSRFNWSHDVNTTFSWGEVQPTQCKLLIPGSKTTMSTQNLIRLAPMVAPTFGRVKYKTFNQFVAMEELFPNFAELMAQEPVYRVSGGSKVPQSLPYAKLGMISTWVLHGARATLYFADPSAPDPAQEAAAGRYITEYRTLSGSTWSVPTNIGNVMTALGNAGVVTGVTDPYGHGTDNSMPDVGTRMVINLSKLNLGINNVYSSGGGIEIVTAAESGRHFVPVTQSYVPGVTNNFYELTPIDQEVTMDSADYVIEGSVTDNGTTYYVAFAFELSDFGKRIRKILQGCGYQINFTSTTNVCVLPLFAQYKAYFDVFGLQLYQGWETTWTAKWIERVAHGGFISDMSTMLFLYNSAGNSNQNALDGWHFMISDIGQEFYTEQPDFIGSHMEKLAVSPNVDKSGFLSVTGTGQISFGANVTNAANVGTDGVSNGQIDLDTTQISANGSNEVHNYISQIQHGEVDAEVLKRIYKWTNRNTILGREIAKILRAQGLGRFVDECKSNYIGATDNLVTISDVVSTAATSDAVLGEYGGRGLQYTNDKTLVFENDEYGYWVTLATIVPDAGYTQGLDTTLTSLKKFDLYNADFDAIGMEMTPKHAVVDTNYCVLNNALEMNASDTGFGFIPRYSKFKVAQNLVNGDFNRHGMRSTYLPYTLDRQLNVNDYKVATEVHDTANGREFTAVQLDRSTRVGALPVAGNVWRMPTKYAWMGNFDRIFHNVGLRDSEKQNLITPTMLVGFADYNSDNFLSHGIYDVQCYAPMKPIEDSYGLEEDEPDKAGADFVTKA